MEFSLEWLTSIPGLLISGGILLLVIALIILIATSGKKKKEIARASQETSQSSTAPIDGAAQAVPAANTTVNGGVPEMNSPAMTGGTIMDIPAPAVQQPTDMNINNNMGMPTTAMQSQMVQPQAPGAEPFAPMPGMTAPAVEPVNPIQGMATPAVEPIAPVQEQIVPTVEPIAPVQEPVMPTVEPIAPVQEPVVPTVEPVASVQATPEPVIYGGANPATPEININEQQHQIYGGANPLENTQSIPISNLVGQQQVVQTPTPEPTMITPQATPTTNDQINMGQ